MMRTQIGFGEKTINVPKNQIKEARRRNNQPTPSPEKISRQKKTKIYLVIGTTG